MNRLLLFASFLGILFFLTACLPPPPHHHYSHHHGHQCATPDGRYDCHRPGCDRYCHRPAPPPPHHHHHRHY